MSQVILKPEHSLNRNSNSDIQDVRVGSPNGILPDFANWANAGKLVKPRLIAVLMRAPDGMQYMPDGEDRIAFLKSMVELLPKSITGLNRSMTVEFLETPVGNAGEQMETVTKTTRERSTPSFVYDEVRGKLITRMAEDWIIDLLMDPSTGHPGVIRYDEYTAAGSPNMGPDFKSAAVLFIEPTESLDGVLSTYLCTNMQPKGFTEEASRTVGEALEGMEQTLEFTAYTLTNEATNKIGLEYLRSLSRNGLAPSALAPFIDAPDKDVNDTAVDHGNRPSLKKAAANL